MKTRRLIMAVDLDKTIASYDKWQDIYTFGEPLPGAKEFLEKIHKFAYIIIHSCRTTPSVVSSKTSPFLLANLVSDWMKKYNMPYDEIWHLPGKPNADIFIDDKGYRIPANPCQADYDKAFNDILDIFDIEHE